MCVQGYLSVPSIAAVKKSDDPEEEALKVIVHWALYIGQPHLLLTVATCNICTVDRHVPYIYMYM